MRRWRQDREQPYRVMQFLDRPKKTGGPDGAVAEPADKSAVGAYRRKAS